MSGNGPAPGTTTSYEKIADDYEESRGGQARADTIAEALARHLPPGCTVLDIGVGTGIIAATLERLGHPLVGVDVSPSMLRQASRRLPGRVPQASGEALPLASRSVDAVTLVWVLHHVASPVAALAEAARVTGPGRRVLVVGARPDEEPTDVREAFAPVLRLHLDRMDPVHDPTPLAAEAGLVVAGASVVTQQFEQSPVDLADAVERRLFSPLFDIDDQRWSAEVQPVVDHLRALPEPTRPRTRVQRYPLHVLTPLR